MSPSLWSQLTIIHCIWTQTTWIWVSALQFTVLSKCNFPSFRFLVYKIVIINNTNGIVVRIPWLNTFQVLRTVPDTWCVPAKSVWSCPTPYGPMDRSPPDSSVHEILQARVLEWVAMPSSRGSSRPRGWNLHLLHLLLWQAGSLPLAPPGKPLAHGKQ